ncbi:P-loop NTPase [candidate division GN15 bacterium]|nr:P-loop NTPase [candidate division GN15 bacterium]
MRIAVASGKGGTGKTTVATNLAAALGHVGRPVVYADCDVEEPNGHLFLNVRPEERREVSVSVPEVLTERCTGCGECADVCEFNAIAMLGPQPTVFPSLCHSCGACIELCPESALVDKPRPVGYIRSGDAAPVDFVGGCLNVGEHQAPPVTKAVLQSLPGDRIMIVDAPPGTSCPVIESVREADYVVLVTEPTPFGLNDLSLACDMLLMLGRPFGVVINRAEPGENPVRTYCEQHRIPILLEIPFDRSIAETYAVGQLRVDVDPAFEQRMLDLYRSIEERRQHA